MERKNTILLTVIAVATLLVAVVGATFAYFTATTAGGTNAGDASIGTAVQVGGVSLSLANTDATADVSYPGGIMVVGAKAVPTVDGNGLFDINYTINAEIDATAFTSENTQITYSLYASDDAVAGALIKANSCKLETKQITNDDGSIDTAYYYTGCAVNDAFASLEPIATKTMSSTAQVEKISVANQQFLDVKDGDEVDTYFYLVVNYVNNDNADQDADQGQAITAKITSITNASSTADAITAE